MFISADRFRVITKADMHAAALIAEGFRRLREQQVSNAGTGAPGSVDLVPAEHASDPVAEPMKEPK